MLSHYHILKCMVLYIQTSLTSNQTIEAEFELVIIARTAIYQVLALASTNCAQWVRTEGE